MVSDRFTNDGEVVLDDDHKEPVSSKIEAVDRENFDVLDEQSDRR